MEIQTWNTKDKLLLVIATGIFAWFCFPNIFLIATMPDPVTLVDTHKADAAWYGAMASITALSGLYVGFLISAWKVEEGRTQQLGALIAFLIVGRLMLANI